MRQERGPISTDTRHCLLGHTPPEKSFAPWRGADFGVQTTSIAVDRRLNNCEEAAGTITHNQTLACPYKQRSLDVPKVIAILEEGKEIF